MSLWGIKREAGFALFDELDRELALIRPNEAGQLGTAAPDPATMKGRATNRNEYRNVM